MPVCRKCSQRFANRIQRDGKVHVLGNRKYCLACSPFGSRNTRKLERPFTEKVCPHCGSVSASRRTNACSGCYARQRRLRVRQKIHALVGDTCWICGYGDEKRRAMLDFHHLHRDSKRFDLNAAATTTYAWATVFAEIQKCALLCCRCHREVESGILDHALVEQVYTKRWASITADEV
jgi:hypothetical protein